ncbi:YolD-like family protein [Bacillus nitratireducens]|uniref:YolD-like family protein n=1 Tax=Bacillus nitratireducens TaxID=2026193 RepID=UPI0005CC9E07|nr:YolD-like family protein [Bacillus nitratireducens]UNP75986.1 YolD-like family protein [Bacillus nitratireducens]
MSSANISKNSDTSKLNQMTITLEQSAGTRKVIKEPTRVSLQNDRERIEDLLLQSFISEREILITYYEDDYFPPGPMTVIEINPLNRYVICIDTFDYKHTFSFIDIIDAH